MDRLYLDYPTHGVLQMQDYLSDKGYQVNHKRVRRLLRLMNLMAIYTKKNLSKLGHAEYVFLYLLKGMEINRCNQVWQIDITYIAMHKGFMYLTAIIDVHSRYIVGWGVSNSLEAAASLSVLKEAIRKHGKPEVVNSDQGAQFTCKEWVDNPEHAGSASDSVKKVKILLNQVKQGWKPVCLYHLNLKY
jgi:putative transposase